MLSKDATVYTNMIYSSSLIQRYAALLCVAVFEDHFGLQLFGA